MNQTLLQTFINKMSVHPNHEQHQLSSVKSVQIVKRYKSYAHIMTFAVVLAISNFYFGYSLVYISTIKFQELIRIYQITIPIQTARGIITGCIPVGAGVGAFMGKKLIHVFSRRNYVLFINIIALISGSTLYARNMIVLIVMRIIQGMCVGMYTSIIPLYINQITPVQIQGQTAPFTQIFNSCGAAVAYLFYYILSVSIKIQNSNQAQDIIWYLVLGFPLIFVVIQTLILLFVYPYQTPKYLLLNHHKKRAKQLIEDIYKPQYVEAVLKQKIQDLQVQKGTKRKIQSSGILQPRKKSIQIQVSVQSQSQSGIQIEEPPTPPLAIFVAIHLMILRQLSGINAVVTYGGQIISRTAPSLRAILPFCFNFQITFGAIVAIFILRKIGKKTLLQIGTVILALCMMIITIGFFIIDSEGSVAFVLILVGLIIFTFTFGVSYGAIIWAYVPEVVQPSIDTIATMITWIFASIVIILFPILKSSVLNNNPSILFLFFCIWLGVSFIVNQMMVIQTRNKTQHQIRHEFNNRKCVCCKEEQHKQNIIELGNNKIDIQNSKRVLDLNKKEQSLQKIKRQSKQKQGQKDMKFETSFQGLNMQKQKQKQNI